MCPRQAGDSSAEIEVTPEMIAAGADVAWAAPLSCMLKEEMDEMVSQVFCAMLAQSEYRCARRRFPSEADDTPR